MMDMAYKDARLICRGSRNARNEREEKMTDVREHEALSAFFSALAERAYKENDLSDVTYALLEANNAFRQFFLDFFFPHEGLEGVKVVIEREHVIGDSRPDFWIRNRNEVYLVEVKIWDGGHHFEQYHKRLKRWTMGSSGLHRELLVMQCEYLRRRREARSFRNRLWTAYVGRICKTIGVG